MAAACFHQTKPEPEMIMNAELENLLMTYCDHEAIGEQRSLRELLTCLRNVARELHLDFQEAMTESEAIYQVRQMQAFDPRL
jgi:hypothetical protein